MTRLFALLTVVLGWGASAQAQVDTATGVAVVDRAVVRLVDDVEIAANQAGMLDYLGVKPGAQVTKGQLLAKSDPREAQAKAEVSKQQHEAALQRASDDIDERYAVKAADVAQAEYRRLQEANSGRVGRVVTQTDLDKARLEWDRSLLAIEKAQKDRAQAGYEAKVREAEYKAALAELSRCEIKAPFDGEVVELFHDESEWANPGDPILQLVRLDTVYVEGDLVLSDYEPGNILGREVLVEVLAGGGRREQAVGRVVHVDQRLVLSNTLKFGVVAEVANRRLGASWALIPGLQATMRIDLTKPAVAVSRSK